MLTSTLTITPHYSLPLYDEESDLLTCWLTCNSLAFRQRFPVYEPDVHHFSSSVSCVNICQWIYGGTRNGCIFLCYSLLFCFYSLFSFILSFIFYIYLFIFLLRFFPLILIFPFFFLWRQHFVLKGPYILTLITSYFKKPWSYVF